MKLLMFGMILAFLSGCNTSGGGGSTIESNYLENPENATNLVFTSPSNNKIYGSNEVSLGQTLAGTCDTRIEGTTLNVSINSTAVGSTTCTSSAFIFTFTPTVLIEGDGNSNIISVQYTSSSGSTTQSINVGKDTTDPTITITTPSQINQANQSGYIVQGTCDEDTRSVTGSVSTRTFTTLCNSTTWISSPIDVSFLADNTYTVTATLTDFYSNSMTTSTSVNKDSTAPVPTLNYLSPTVGFGNTGSTSMQMINIISGDTIKIYTDSSCAAATLKNETATGATHNFTFTTATEANYLYYYTIDFSGGGTSPCYGPKSFSEDRTAPAAPLTYNMSSPAVSTLSNDSTPIFSGTVAATEENGTVQVFRNASCTLSVGSGIISGGAYNILGSLPIDGSAIGVNSFYMKVVDQAGNTSGCIASGLSYNLKPTGLASLPKIAMVGTNSDTSIISLEASNTITHKKIDGTNVVLGTFADGELVPTIQVNQGDILESTGAFYPVTRGFGTAPWASEAYAGTEFTSFITRNGQHQPKLYIASVEGTAFVQIKQSGATVDSASIAINTVKEFTVTLTNNLPFQVVSDKKVNVYFVSRGNGTAAYERDARVLTPAATTVIGFSGEVTSSQDLTTGVAYRNSPIAPTTFTNMMQTGFAFPGDARDGDKQWAVIVIADKPVAVNQTADNNGNNSSPSLPIGMMATHYGIPRAADYVTFASPDSGTVSVIDETGSPVGTFPMTRDPGADANAPYSYRYKPGGNIAAGHRFVCSAKCYAYYDDNGPGADKDETLMMGHNP